MLGLYYALVSGSILAEVLFFLAQCEYLLPLFFLGPVARQCQFGLKIINSLRFLWRPNASYLVQCGHWLLILDIDMEYFSSHLTMTKEPRKEIKELRAKDGWLCFFSQIKEHII